VRAAEEEAEEIIAEARAEAEKIRGDAEGRALETMARAEDQASQAADEARRRAADLLRDARTVAGSVKAEGVELTEHLRELSDSLRTNAGRLLRDVLDAHAALTAELDRVDGGAPAEPSRPEPNGARERPRRRPAGGDLDVPEFMPGPR
jgi:vacuolar-type H+-ATPase subunit H